MRVDEILRRVDGPDVLDVGCAGHKIQPGDAAWLHGRLRERFNVTGIDISQSNIDQLRALGFDNLHVQSADSFELGRKFDSIVAGEVIEHMSNPGQFLAHSRRHLSSEGRIVLSTPYAFSLMYAFYATSHFPKTCENGEHTSWFCPSTIGELAGREGLEIAEWTLIDDYDYRVPSWKYQFYWTLARTIGRLLPDRLMKTTLLVVLRPEMHVPAHDSERP